MSRQGPIDKNDVSQLNVGTIANKYYHCDGTENASDSFVPLYRVNDRYHRDGNTSNPQDPSGWRNPAPFLHYRIYTEHYQVGDQISVSEFGPPCEKHFALIDSAAVRADGYGGPDVGFDSEIGDLALVTALGKLQDQKVNLAQNFVERKQTLELADEVIKTIAGTVRAFRRGIPTSTWSEIKRRGAKRQNFNHFTPGQKWLELQYGWKPLMSDLKGAADQIKSGGLYSKADRVVVKARKKRRQAMDPWVLITAGPGAQRITWNWNRSASVSLHYCMDNSLLPMFNSLGLVNPVELAWEELPYSFVVDWFLPVGNWLNAMTADLGWSYLGGSNSYKADSTHRATGRVTYVGTNPNGVADGSVSFYKYAAGFSRTMYTTSPVPQVHFKNPLSSLHVSEALALLQKAFR